MDHGIWFYLLCGIIFAGLCVALAVFADAWDELRGERERRGE